MFTNLIESNADRSAFKRRSSFFLATVAAYALILSAAVIVGVLTYDAQVEAQNTDLAVLNWIPPVKPVTPKDPQPATLRRPRQANASVDRSLTESVRTRIETQTNDPSRIPDRIGIKASDIPPAVGRVRLGDQNVDPAPNTGLPGCVSCAPNTPATVVDSDDAPLPQPTVKPKTQTLPSRVLIAKVVSLPKPTYPTIAKQIRAQGPVNVQILVDESGKVISAHAVSGNAALVAAAEEAARRALFTPTLLNNQPVKVQGVITYNFVLQ